MQMLRQARLSMMAAAVFATAAAAWAMVGTVLPGGRWLTVHLLTIGVASNLLVGLMPYFARTVLHVEVDDRSASLRLVLLNAGAVSLLAGLPAGSPVALALGATAVSAAVLLLWLALRQARRRALPSRFGFVGRAYERACGAFLHGAILGAAMGLALVPGAWYPGIRLAHLHVNLLGWVGLPLLATLVTLGPTIMRTRMADGAAPRAARALSVTATALTVAVVALALSGAPGTAGRALELGAAAGLAVYAWGVASVCLPVLAVWARRVPSLAASLLASSCVWFLLAVAADVLLVAAGAFRLLDVVAPALLVGVLVQAVLGSLLHLLPMAMARSAADRTAMRGRLDSLPPGIAVASNGAILLLTTVSVAARAAGWLPAGAVTAAWAIVAAGVLLLGSAMAWACVPTGATSSPTAGHPPSGPPRASIP